MLRVPPGSSASYTITYRPLTMAGSGMAGGTPPHEGSAFFALPDGQGLIHKLEGIAEPPAAEGRVERCVPAKVAHTEVLRVSNWLPRPQRFRVSVERRTAAPATQLEGAEYLEVPALAEREHRLTFMAYSEVRGVGGRGRGGEVETKAGDPRVTVLIHGSRWWRGCGCAVRVRCAGTRPQECMAAAVVLPWWCLGVARLV